jgi:sodium transport system permease protein
MSPLVRHTLTVYKKELRESLRDRRTLISMFVVPTIAIPLLMLGFAVVTVKLVTQAKSEASSVMILGAAQSPAVKAALAANPKLKIVPPDPGYRAAISGKSLRAAVELADDFDLAVTESRRSDVRIYHYDGDLKSGIAANELDRFFRDYREQAVQATLSARGLPPALARPYDIKRQNVAPPEKVGGAMFGGIIPYVIVLLCFTGAMYPAMDLTAGEKERGTLETLLASPVPRSAIVYGKFFVVLTSALSTVIFAGLSTMITLPLSGWLLGGMVKGSAVAAGAGAGAAAGMMPQINPLGFLVSLGMVVPVAILFAAVLLAVSIFARTYKEAQSYAGPMIMVVIMPAVAAMLPGIELNLRLCLIPILNVSLVSKELVSGTFNPVHLAVIFGSSCVYAAAALAFATQLFKRESVLFRT